MNKHGEIISIASLLLILLIGIIYLYEGEIKDKQYIGDKSTSVVYNLKSNSGECNLDSIKIDDRNIIFFTNVSEALNSGFRLDTECH